MNIGENEEKISEYYFKGTNDVKNMSVLTDRRLIVNYKNAEESYPLSKITAVKTIFNRSWFMTIFGGIIALVSLSVFAESIVSGSIVLVVGGALTYFGWIGKTQLLIKQMGGEKFYKVRGKDTKLTDFMDLVNSRLS